MGKVKKSNQVAQMIRGSIVDGVIKIEEKLTEIQFTSSLNTSRASVREAFIQLEQEGFITKKKGSYQIRHFNLSEVIDAIKLRSALEGTAGKIAAEKKLSPEMMQSIWQTIKEIDEVLSSNNFDQYSRLNTSFHEQMINLSGSSFVVGEVLRSYRFPFAHPSGFATNARGLEYLCDSIKEANEQHKNIVRSIEQGNTTQVFELIVQHALHAISNVEVAFLNRAKTIEEHQSLVMVT